MADRAALAPELVKQIQGWTNDGTGPDVVEQILKGHFTGQRDALRTYKFIDAQVQGIGGAYAALVVNISRSGMLFRITDEAFAGESETRHLMPYTARVWHNFQGGFHVHLEEGAVSRAAQIVRVSGYCGPKNSLVLIGCRFASELTPEECETLGIAYSGDEAPGAGNTED
jgi:hypothetical protein